LLLITIVAVACGNCEKVAAFCAQAFSSSGGNHQGNIAEGLLYRFPRLRQFPQASPSAAFFLFCFFFLSLCLDRKVVQNISRQDRL
jgi:hypothetical protein